MRLLDLSRTFEDNMPVFPGDAPARLACVAGFPKDVCTIHRVDTGMHVGTHMDSPLHFVPGGKRMNEIPVKQFFGRGRLLDARGRDVISPDLLNGVELHRGDIVLVWTDWSRRFKESDYFEKYPVLDTAFGQKLVDAGVHVVGLDTPSPDRAPYATHQVLLGGGVLIAENLINLEALAGVKEFEVIALPVKFDAEAGLARVVARVRE